MSSPAQASQIAPSQNQATWSPSLRVFFRLAFSYLALYIVTFAPRIFRTPIARTQVELWNPFVVWTAKHLLGITYAIEPPVGDTAFEYVLIFCIALVAISLTAVWSFADRKRKSYALLHQWLRLALRLWLATYLISYGAGKVIPAQFLTPSPARYIGTYGDSSAMGLLWTFMGVSPGYQMFSGAVELCAGLLLLMPRITTLGALFAIPAITNVLVLNMAYDVQVKIFSAHLLVAAIFLIAPDLRNLFSLFIVGEKVALNRSTPLFVAPWKNRVVVYVQLMFGLYATILMLLWAHERVKVRSELSRTTPFYGIWYVDEFQREGIVRAPLTTDDIRWRAIVIDSPSSIVIQMMDGSLQKCILKLDQHNHKATIIGHDPEREATFSYTSEKNGLLAFDGTIQGHVTAVKLHHVDSQFPLDFQGVRWVHRFPPYFR